MLAFIDKRAKTLAIIWFIFISVLFFLPGSALPKEDWLDAINFDKLVHVCFFALLVYLWRFYLPAQKKFNWLMLLLAIVYGFAVEVIQYYFIPNRSFDLLDATADTIGATVGLWFWSGRYIKK